LEQLVIPVRVRLFDDRGCNAQDLFLADEEYKPGQQQDQQTPPVRANAVAIPALNPKPSISSMVCCSMPNPASRCLQNLRKLRLIIPAAIVRPLGRLAFPRKDT